MTRIDSRKLIRWYDFQAPFYGLWRNDFDGELVRSVVAAVAAGRPARVLDDGCGAGLFAVPLARGIAASRVEGIDLSRGMLRVAERARRRAALNNLRLQQGDASALPYADGSFDAVVMAGLLPNVNEPVAVLREAGRVLTGAGRLYVVEFDRTSMGAGARWLFRVLILGYKGVSFVFRRFRFAEKWNLEASTVERRQLAGWIEAAGLEILAETGSVGHAIYTLSSKGAPA